VGETRSFARTLAAREIRNADTRRQRDAAKTKSKALSSAKTPRGRRRAEQEAEDRITLNEFADHFAEMIEPMTRVRSCAIRPATLDGVREEVHDQMERLAEAGSRQQGEQ